MEVPEQPHEPTVSRGYWRDTAIRFCRRKLSLAAFCFVGFLVALAVFSPAIAGTRPIVCRYKGSLYFPALYYFKESWENPVFFQDKFYQRFPKNLAQKDPASWAFWPLVYQDPYRRVEDQEWPGMAGNPGGADKDLGPSRQNFFGVDQRGVDVFAQLVHGTRIALLVGFVSTGIAATIGIVVGAIAGYAGGWIDMLFSRLIDLVMSVPPLVLILAMMAIVTNPSTYHLMAVIGATSWTNIARFTRGEFLKLKELDYVAAARALGAGPLRIIFRQILPNALAPVLVPISFGIASAIIVEGALRFLGIGASPSTPSWGTLLAAGKSNLQMWWLTFFPGLIMFLAVLAYNLIGEGLQEATDPRLREAGK